MWNAWYVSQAFGQQAGASDDFQELCAEDKGVLKKKFSMDAALEDKICDLYDLFVDVQNHAFSALFWKFCSSMVEETFLILSYSQWI